VTYGYAAALRFARTLLPGRPASGIKYVSLDSHDKLCEAAAEGRVDAAVVAIENTASGVIADTIAAIERQLWTVGGVRHGLMIQSEVSLPIVHRLLSPTGKLSDLVAVHSHQSGLHQCHRTIQRLNAIRKAHKLPALVEKWTQSTGEAANNALADLQGTTGTIASERAVGKSTGRQTLQDVTDDLSPDGSKWDGRIVDYPESNRTRFWVLARRTERVPGVPSGGPKATKTCLLTNPENKAGVLQRILAAFYPKEDADGISVAEADCLSLTLIHALPMPNRLWEYAFFTEFVGDIQAPVFRTAFDHLLEKGMVLTPPIWLGSYPRDPDEMAENEWVGPPAKPRPAREIDWTRPSDR
jgi:prephenate dehydratase